MIKSRPTFALIAPGGGRGDFIARPGSHVIMFSVGRFTCKEPVMLIEGEIRLLLYMCKQVVFCHVQT